MMIVLDRMESERMTLSPQAERDELVAINAELSHRLAQCEQHNEQLTTAATGYAGRLQDKAKECSRVAVELHTARAECDELRAKVIALKARGDDLEQHNEKLTAAAVDYAERLQKAEADLVEKNSKLYLLQRERDELAAKVSALLLRVSELGRHNEDLTAAATDYASRLQKVTDQKEEVDYQVLMIYQKLLAELKDLDSRFYDIFLRCKPYTMTSVERMYALYKSVEYIVAAGVPGDFVETGTWKGGSCMLIAETLLALGEQSRKIFLFDTFEGHPKPDEHADVDLWGNPAVRDWEAAHGGQQSSNWAYASLDAVRENMSRTGYPEERIVFVKGLVEETAPSISIPAIAILRLDTDWYASTKASLESLFPQLAHGGVLIVDDYGHYRGQRQAVDEYVAANRLPLLLTRVDYSCRLAIKCDRKTSSLGRI